MNRYEEVKRLTEKPEIVKGMNRQIQSLLDTARNYWSYYCQYKKLDEAQIILQSYYEDGELKENVMGILDQLYIDFAWKVYDLVNIEEKKKTSKSEFWEILANRKITRYLSKKGIEHSEKIEEEIYRAYISMCSSHDENCKLDYIHINNLKKAIELLKENQTVTMKSYEESFGKIFNDTVVDEIIWLSGFDDEKNQTTLYWLIASIRQAMTYGEITNRMETDARPNRFVYFKSKNDDSFCVNLEKTKSNIEKILKKYPQNIIEDFELDVLEVEELFSKIIK